MVIPSRKRLVTIIFLVFLVAFFIGVILYFLPVITGNTTYDEQGNPIRTINLFPFGNTNVGTGGDTGTTNPDTGVVGPGGPGGIDSDTGRMPRLRQIAEGPIIGAYLYPAPGNSGLIGPVATSTTDSDVENTIRYIELGTGHVYQGSTVDPEIARLSNTTIPRINQAMFTEPDRLLIRYEDEFNRVKTFSAELVLNNSEAAGSPKKIQGIFLTDDIARLDISPTGKLLYTVASETNSRNTLFMTSDDTGSNKTQVFSLPISEWNVSWHGQEDSALITSVPSYNSYGVSYTLDTKTGTLAPYVPARRALFVVASNDFSRALLGMNIEGETKLYTWDRPTNQYIDLGLSGFAEKCVWAQVRAKFYCAIAIQTIAEAEPDLWYQGVSQYQDGFWEIDPVTGRSSLMVLPAEYTDRPIDAIDMAITSDEQFLYFRDKYDRSLWSLQIDYDQAQPISPSTVISGEDGTDEFFE